MKKRITAALLAAALAFTALPADAFAMYEDKKETEAFLAGQNEETGVYVLMNIPFDKFYESEGVVSPDVYTSPTVKVLSRELADGSYHDGFSYTEKSSGNAKMLGVTYPVLVEDAGILEEFTEVTDESSAQITVAADKKGITLADVAGRELLFASPSYAWYRLSETPNRYKTLTVKDGVLTFGAVTGDVKEGGALDAALLYLQYPSPLKLPVANAEVADCDRVNAVILTTSDGSEIALRPMYNIWKRTQLGWNYNQWDLGGKTIASVRYYLEKDGVYDVIEYSCGQEVKLGVDPYLDADFVSADCVRINELPEDIENPRVKAQVLGTSETILIAENAPIEDGLAHLSEAAVLGTQYRVTVVSDNYRDIYSTELYTGVPPVILSVSAAEDGMKVVWTPVEGACSYMVFRNGLLADTPTDCEYLDTGANEDGAAYTYRLKSVSEYNGQLHDSYSSEEASGVYLERPEAEEISAENGRVFLQWQGTEAADGYRILCNGAEVCRVENSGSGEDKAFGWTGSLTLKKGKVYEYTVRAFAEKDGTEYESADSEALSAAGIGEAEIVSAKNAASGVKVSWKKVEGVTGYFVFRNGEKIKSVVGEDTLSFLDKGANVNGTAYSYRILPVLRDGARLYAGKCKNTVTSVFVNRPEISCVDNTPYGCRVAWKKVPGAAGYYIYRNGKKVKAISGDSTLNYIDKKAQTNGTEYTYRVIAAIRQEGVLYKSAASLKASGIFLKESSIRSLKNSKAGKMTVTWTKNAIADGYQFYILYGEKRAMRTAGASVTSKTFSVTKGRTYTLMVRPYKKVGSVTYYAYWSEAKTVSIKK